LKLVYIAPRSGTRKSRHEFIIEVYVERTFQIFSQIGRILLSAQEKGLESVLRLIAVEKMPGWVRVAEIVLGLVSLFAGALVIAYPGLGFFTLEVILAVGLIFLGSRDVVLGGMGTFLPKWLRAADIVFGVLAFILSVIVIASPGVAATTLVIFLYFALFVRGVAAISMAQAGKMFSTRLRAVSAVVGVLSIILAVVFLAYPGLAIGTLIFVLSVGLLFVGIEAIAAGVIGREIVPLIGSVERKI
jgi:uncharacterized membrane protein HdeD (DUF308 family)